MRLGLSLSRKKVEWKCCIKPLIRVEHIRLILRAQSGSCYAAACVVLVVTEFPPLIGVHISVWMNWECCVCVCVCAMWYLMQCVWVNVKVGLGKAWGMCIQADAKQVVKASSGPMAENPDGAPSSSSFTPPSSSLYCAVPVFSFFSFFFFSTAHFIKW